MGGYIKVQKIGVKHQVDKLSLSNITAEDLKGRVNNGIAMTVTVSQSVQQEVSNTEINNLD